MVVKMDEKEFVKVRDGVRKQSLAYGDKTHMVMFFLEKSKAIPEHTHAEHEQTGYLIKGKMIMTIEGTHYELEGGASWSIKSGVPHGVQMLEDCTVIEVFSPVREDYLD